MPCSSGQFDNYGPDYSDIRKLQTEIDKLTAVLCEFLTKSEAEGGPEFSALLAAELPIASAWWENHKALDKRR